MIDAALLVAGLNALPTLPESVAKLSALLASDQASGADFERVVRPDPALTANLLRAANSVFYRGVNQVKSVRDAVTRMGKRYVFEIATSASFATVLPPRIAGYELEPESFWRHCIAVAIICERLANDKSIMLPDVAFTTGLLHDVGKLVISICLQAEKRTWRQGELASVIAERAILGVDHGDVGEEIALRWRLPEQVKDGARWHHEPDSSPDGVDRSSADMVCLADLVSYRLGMTGQGEWVLADYARGALIRLGLTVDHLEMIADDAIDEIEKMAEVTLPAHPRGH